MSDALYLRSADYRDLSLIQQLFNQSCAPSTSHVASASSRAAFDETLFKRFGKFELKDLIDRNCLSIVAIDSNSKECVAFVSFANFPVNLTPFAQDPAYQHNLWHDWIKERYQIPQLFNHNGLFLACFVAISSVAVKALQQSLQTAFLTFPEHDVILQFLPGSVALFPPLNAPAPFKARPNNNKQKFDSYFQEVKVKDTNANSALYCCHRGSVMPPWKVRTARVEDCDDLVPLLKKQKMLAADATDYYVAELIESKLPGTKTLVAEHNGRVVAFMALANQVKSAFLLQTYYLDMFDSLLQDDKSRSTSLKDLSVGNNEMENTINLQVSLRKSDQNLLALTSAQNTINLHPKEEEIDLKPTNIRKNESSITASASKLNQEMLSSSPFQKSSLNRLTAAVSGSQQSLLRARDIHSSVPTLDLVDSSHPVISTGNDVNLPNLLSSMDELDCNTDSCMRLVKSRRSSLDQDFVDDSNEKDNNNQRENLENAFCITLFCVEDGLENMSTSLIRPAFSCFPEQDYCLLTLPSTTPEIPLLKRFNKIPPRIGRSPSECLFLTNRNAFTSHFVVSPYTSDQFQHVAQFIRGIAREQQILKVLQSFHPSPETSQDEMKELNAVAWSLMSTWFPQNYPVNKDMKPQIYTVQCQEQCIGLIMLNYIDSTPLISHYDISLFLSPQGHDLGGHPSSLALLILNPIWQHWSRDIIDQACQQSQSSALFYAFNHKLSQDNPSSVSSDLSTRSTVLKEFYAVRPRRRPAALSNDFMSTFSDYPLTLMSNALLREPRIHVNTRLVIVGASHTGLSFIESLLYRSHLHFDSITIISSHGLQPLLDQRSFTPDFTADNLSFHRNELKSLGFLDYLHSIKGWVTNIDRQNKTVHLGNGGTIPYDYLVLTPGLQYHTSYLAGMTHPLSKTDNVVGANLQDTPQLQNLAARAARSNRNVIIFGASLDALASLQGCLMAGVKSEKLFLICPEAPTTTPSPISTSNAISTSFTNNKFIDSKIHEYIQTQKIQLYNFANVKEWNVQGSKLQSIQISVKTPKGTNIVEINDIEMFVHAHLKSPNPKTFQAFNNSCLVFDESLIITNQFRTHDPFIYAAGPITKYSVVYKTHWSHDLSESREVGQKLAETLAPLFDPLSSILNVKSDEIISFVNSKKVYALFPDNYHYFKFETPHLKGLSDEQMNPKQADFGRLLESSKSDPYFRFHLNPNGFIISLTYFGKSMPNIWDWLTLHGRHEKYLNRMVSRFEEGIITDFTKYLGEPWTLALYHDRFGSFLELLRREMMAHQGIEHQNILSKFKSYVLANEGQPTNRAMQSSIPRAALYDLFDKSQERHLHEAKLIEFFEQELSMSMREI